MSISFDGLKQSTMKEIETVLKKLPGSKHLLIDPSLFRALDRCVSMRFLRSLGVQKVFKIQKLPPESSVTKIAYVVPPNKEAVQTVIEHAEVDRKNNIKRYKLVAFVPKQTVMMKTLLEARGLLGNDLIIADLSFGWIPIDNDLISLNLPEVYTNYFLHGDTSWPYHLGQMIGQVLETVLSPDQSPTDLILHAFGSAAQVSAAGLGSAIGRLEATKSPNPNSSITETPKKDHDAPNTPMFILFSRNLDYITTFMVPTTFEALIHEVIGIENGIIQLPNVQANDTVPSSLNLHSSVTPSFQEIRDAHISTVHTWLQTKRSGLEDSRTGLGFSLTALDRELPLEPGGPLVGVPSTSKLSDLSAQLKPLLIVRKELTALLICLEEVMKKMAKDERVEDLLSAQTKILQSGSGGAVAIAQGLEASASSNNSSALDDQMPSEAATGACADDATSQPVRLALEWMSTRFGDRLTEAVRLLCLLSVTHDGLSEELYGQVTRHIQHAVGFAILPLLMALSRLKVLTVRRSHSMSNRAAQRVMEVSKVTAGPRKSILAQVGAEKLTSATERLIKRRKSTYNYLHRVLHLSLNSQANLGADKPAVSPSYVFGGQHVPVVVRLAESLWAAGLEAAGGSVGGKLLLGGAELPKRQQIVSALSLLHTDERSANNLGRIPLASGSGNSESGAHKTAGAVASHGQTVVVVFVGGCTYAEVAALRFAAQRRCWRLLMATSQMLSTKSIIQQRLIDGKKRRRHPDIGTSTTASSFSERIVHDFTEIRMGQALAQHHSLDGCSSKETQTCGVNTMPAEYGPQHQISPVKTEFQKDQDCGLMYSHSTPCSPVYAVKFLPPTEHSVLEAPNETEVDGINRPKILPKPMYFINCYNGSHLVLPAFARLDWSRIYDNREIGRCSMRWTETVLQLNFQVFKEWEQMVNHIPNCGHFTNKLGLLLSLRSYAEKKKTTLQKDLNLNFIPDTYWIDDPKEKQEFMNKQSDDQIFIFKPCGLNQGKGISLIRTKMDFARLEEYRLEELRRNPAMCRPRIVQKYLTHPLLLNRKKFDLRCYLMIVSTMPYLVLFSPGYVRLSLKNYDPFDPDLCTHLTNQFVQKKDPNYQKAKNDTVWTFRRLNDYINTYVATNKRLPKNWVTRHLIPEMQRISSQVFNAVKDRLACRVGFFEIYGMDFMVDDAMKVWLIEINSNPAMNTNCEVLRQVIPPIVSRFIDISIECFEKARRWQPLLPIMGILPRNGHDSYAQADQRPWYVSLRPPSKHNPSNSGLPLSFAVLYNENLVIAKSRQSSSYKIPLRLWAPPRLHIPLFIPRPGLSIVPSVPAPAVSSHSSPLPQQKTPPPQQEMAMTTSGRTLKPGLVQSPQAAPQAMDSIAAPRQLEKQEGTKSAETEQPIIAAAKTETVAAGEEEEDILLLDSRPLMVPEEAKPEPEFSSSLAVVPTIADTIDTNLKVPSNREEVIVVGAELDQILPFSSTMPSADAQLEHRAASSVPSGTLTPVMRSSRGPTPTGESPDPKRSSNLQRPSYRDQTNSRPKSASDYYQGRQAPKSASLKPLPHTSANSRSSTPKRTSRNNHNHSCSVKLPSLLNDLVFPVCISQIPPPVPPIILATVAVRDPTTNDTTT